MSIGDAELSGLAAIQLLDEAMQALNGARESAEQAVGRVHAMFGESDAPAMSEILGMVGDTPDGVQGIAEEAIVRVMAAKEAIEAYIARIRAAGA